MIKKIIIIAIVVIVGIVSIKTIHTNLTSKTGAEWFDEQEAYISNLETWASELDDVTALYLNGNIDQNNYSAHLDLLEKELALLKADYYRGKEKVKIGSYNEMEKMGCDSVEDCFSVMSEMIQMTKEYKDSPEQLSYSYIAFQQKLVDALDGYSVSLSSERGDTFE